MTRSRLRAGRWVATGILLGAAGGLPAGVTAVAADVTDAGDREAVVQVSVDVPERAMPAPSPTGAPTSPVGPSASPSPSAAPADLGTEVSREADESALAVTGASPWIVGAAAALAAILIGAAARAPRRQSRTSPRS